MWVHIFYNKKNNNSRVFLVQFHPELHRVRGRVSVTSAHDLLFLTLHRSSVYYPTPSGVKRLRGRKTVGMFSAAREKRPDLSALSQGFTLSCGSFYLNVFWSYKPTSRVPFVTFDLQSWSFKLRWITCMYESCRAKLNNVTVECGVKTWRRRTFVGIFNLYYLSRLVCNDLGAIISL